MENPSFYGHVSELDSRPCCRDKSQSKTSLGVSQVKVLAGSGRLWVWPEGRLECRPNKKTLGCSQPPSEVQRIKQIVFSTLVFSNAIFRLWGQSSAQDPGQQPFVLWRNKTLSKQDSNFKSSRQCLQLPDLWKVESQMLHGVHLHLFAGVYRISWLFRALVKTVRYQPQDACKNHYQSGVTLYPQSACAMRACAEWLDFLWPSSITWEAKKQRLSKHVGVSDRKMVTLSPACLCMLVLGVFAHWFIRGRVTGQLSSVPWGCSL